MTRYNFADREVRSMILIHVWTDFSLIYFYFRSTVCELGANNEQMWLSRFIIKYIIQNN